MTGGKATEWPAGLWILLLLTAAYLPLLAGNHINGDDWYLFQHATLNGQGSLDVGRPLHGVFVVLYGFFLHDLADANLLRLASLLALAASGFLMYRYFRPQLGRLASLALAVSILCLPAYQFYVAGIVCGSYNFGVLFAVSAAYLSRESASAYAKPAAGLLVISALLCYQPTALIVVALLAFDLLWSPDTKAALRSLFGKLVLLGSSMAIYWAGWALYLNQLNVYQWKNATGANYDGRQLALSLTAQQENFAWFLGELLPHVLTLWMAPWSQRFGVMPVAVLVVFASAVALDLGRSRQAVALVGAKYLAILVLLPLSCLTLFAAGAKVPVFRVYPGLAALLVIWLFYGLYRILDAMAVPARLHGGLYALVLLAAIVSGITGSYRYYTQNYVQEIVYVKEQIEGYRTSHGGLFPEHVNVVFPSKDYRGNYGFYDGDVYNLSSADRHRPRLYFAQVLRELGAGNDAIERLKVTTAFEPDKLDSSKPNVLLIDMRPLRFFWGPS